MEKKREESNVLKQMPNRIKRKKIKKSDVIGEVSRMSSIFMTLSKINQIFFKSELEQSFYFYFFSISLSLSLSLRPTFVSLHSIVIQILGIVCVF